MADHQPAGQAGRSLIAPALAGLAALATLALSACGSSTTPATSGSVAAATATPSSSSGGATANITVAAADVAGHGTVLVNGKGQTLYILSSEKGGKLTCTDANGCTAVWPDTELPQGTTQAIAGAGIQTSLLGTITSSEGKLYVTYGGWPMYTYTGDNATGQANGQGIVSFGGTWTAVTVAGSAAS
jgi:predicted lipoprotein with Yx(FWY)xxD motif